MSLPELLAPAGGFDAAVAAFHYGADAVYTGLDRFSARADAENMTPERLAVLLAHARSLTPPRKVYCTLNTLLLDDELAGAAETLDILDDLGVDGVIAQDWGLITLARRLFPRLPLHASTQMAVHSRAGVRAVAACGCTRVILARELTLDEIEAAVRTRHAEVEVFIHGALCYAMSGLCLFSSHALGRSGNRGRCAYCCRGLLREEAGGSDASHPFSMRDLAWLPHIRRLADMGVASLKIEGRMKSPLYVAAITDLYRHALDGTLTPDEEKRKVANMQTIFSRPWTDLYAVRADADARTLIDPSAVGHRGTRIGTVLTVLRDARGRRWLRFRTCRALEKHDGIQIEPATGGQPEGFAVGALRRFPGTHAEITVPADCDVEVELPSDIATIPAPGAAIYCSASQAVRRAFPVPTVRPSALAPSRTCTVTVTLAADGITFEAVADDVEDDATPVTLRLAASLTPARSPDRTEAAVRKAFERTRDAGWRVSRLTVVDADTRYAPPSLLNEGRRQVLTALTHARATSRQTCREHALHTLLTEARIPTSPVKPPLFVAKVHLTQPPCDALHDAAEVVIQLGHTGEDDMRRALDAWSAILPRERFRLATPLIVRDSEEAALETRLRLLHAEGWPRWEVPDLASLDRVRRCVASLEDVTADWSLYALNRAAAHFLGEQGIARRVSSPEETRANLAACTETGVIEALVFQQTPLFIAQTPPCSAGGKPADAATNFTDRRGKILQSAPLDGQWITTAQTPFACAEAIPDLLHHGIHHFRCDWSWHPVTAAAMTTVWRSIRAGISPPGSHDANFSRGLR